MQKLLHKYLLTEFPLKGDFDENRGTTTQVSEVSSGQEAASSCKGHSAPHLNDSLLGLGLAVSAISHPDLMSLQMPVCKGRLSSYKGAQMADTLDGSEEALFMLRMKHSQVLPDVGIKTFRDIGQ